jgi:metacaspase-1
MAVSKKTEKKAAKKSSKKPIEKNSARTTRKKKSAKPPAKSLLKPSRRIQPRVAQSGSRRALCVGINLYPLGGATNLKGCVNDANAWANLFLSRFGFSRENIKLLIDSEATRKHILEALRDSVARSSSGDLIVFHNSSHGSYVADTTSDEETYDEILCPYDIKDNHILDDELREIVAGLPKGVRMSVILDNCFSGTGTRFAPIPTPDDRRVRFLDPSLRGLPVLRDFAAAKPRSAERYPMSQMRDVLLTGCSDQEFSYDANIDGTYHGAMSYCAIRAIEQAEGNLTYAALHKKILAAMRYPQHPQLEGAKDNLETMIFR